MDYFLESIAKSLYSEFGNTLNRHCLVFPGRRAGLYFMKYLAARLEKPVWAPAIMTVNDLFRTFTNLDPAENEILLFELYRIFCSVTKSKEGFDEFYFWGDMLLSDFDDIDKYLADAGKIFAGVSDIRKIDQQFGGLTLEQGEIIRQFWTNLNSKKPTTEKSKFLDIWSSLYEIYKGLKTDLAGKNIAYEGMIFRDVIENDLWKNESGQKWDIFHFIGFNALNECEKALMSGLKSENRARFYWDYDNSYLNPGRLNSAGFFLKDNIKLFGNNMPEGWSCDTFLSVKTDNVRRIVIDTSSDIAQVKLIPRLISKLPGITPETAHETAVVLADEGLLVPVLTSLPEKVNDINVTMGYPLRQTQVYSLVKQLLELQDDVSVSGEETSFGYRNVLIILKNSIIAGLLEAGEEELISEITEKNLIRIPAGRFSGSRILSSIFRKCSTIPEIAEYLKTILSLIAATWTGTKRSGSVDSLTLEIRNEFIYRVVLSINRLRNITEKEDVAISVKTWKKILDRLLRTQSVPFSGEPLTGIQIMGILETRALDFRNIVFLSVNDGILPSISGPSSFIPFSIREAFRLPSVNHQESVYAYHFYRLLQRAENVYFVFNSNPEDLRSGEMSRFLQQMKYEPLQVPEFLGLRLDIRNPVSGISRIEKNEEHLLRLYERFCGEKGGKKISPLAINTWLGCRMRFYYRYVNDLKEPEKVTEEIDPAMLGILLHESLRRLYLEYTGKVVDVSVIESFMADGKTIPGIVNDTLSHRFGRGDRSIAAINEMIAVNVLQAYIKRILEIDRGIAPFKLIALEGQVSFSLKMESGRTISIGGGADRIDYVKDTTRIADYKTGTIAESLSSVDLLFKDDRPKDTDGWLQTMIYCEGYLNMEQNARVRPSIYKVKRVPSEGISDMLFIKTGKNEGFQVDDFSLVREQFLEGITKVVNSIFSPDEPFTMTADQFRKCSWCPYSGLCMRNI